MNKIIKRFLVLGILLVCLGFTAFGNLNAAQTGKLCLKQCYADCHTERDRCLVLCPHNPEADCYNVCGLRERECQVDCDSFCQGQP